MGYTLKKINIRNFKYIKENNPMTFDFKNRNIVILDGQNGYGKTTLFDAIEILLTGRIKHFNTNLQNRKTETLGTLANDNNRDIVISGILSNDTKEEILLERKLLSKEDFKSELRYNGETINQDVLYERLQYNLSMFDIGTYISQNESLNFLQNKYKERKEYITSLMDNSEISGKIDLLKEIQKKLEDSCEQEKKKLEEVSNGRKTRKGELEDRIKNINMISDLPGENIRLFSDKEYLFDTIKENKELTYEAVIMPIRQIESFVSNYDEYIKYIENEDIKELLNISMQTFMALFYSKEIIFINENQEKINCLNQCSVLMGELYEKKWQINEVVFRTIGVTNECKEKIKNLLLNQQQEENRLEESDKVLAQMTKSREILIGQFKNSVKEGDFENNKCPLCGTEFEDIDEAIRDTEKYIKDIHTDGVKRIEDFETELEHIFEKDVIPKAKRYLEENKLLLQLKDNLSESRYLSTDRIHYLLKKVGIGKFASEDDEVFNLQEFRNAYEVIKKELHDKEVPNNLVLKEEELELYRSIHNTYYHNKKPYHTIEQLQSKGQYIIRHFNNKVSLELLAVNEALDKAEKDYQKYVTKSDYMLESIKLLINKYELANKDYQTQLANAIKIPIMIYSGRIIQNYPLGLGVRVVVNTNQLFFEAGSKTGNDVYNILSTGQLNGLAIAFLLSVRNVYGHPDGLDILLIDDPLQTIDDISAISLADLFAQQGIGQIVVSTHEESKAALLRYKFTKSGMSVLERDMQELYMKSATKRE